MKYNSADVPTFEQIKYKAKVMKRKVYDVKLVTPNYLLLLLINYEYPLSF